MAYKKLLWGFLFFIDIRIGGFDILPDFIGFLSIFSGLALVEDRNEFYPKAKKIAFVMIFVSFFDLFSVEITTFNSTWTWGVLLFGLASTVAMLSMVYCICSGLSEEFDKSGLSELAIVTSKRWQLYLIATILMYVVILFPIPLIFILVALLSLVSYILMVELMHRASLELDWEA